MDSAASSYPEGGLPHGEHPHDYGYGEVRCARCEGYDLPQLPHALGCPNDEPLILPAAGRFVLFVQTVEGDFCVTSWDTWEEASAAFPIGDEHVLRDGETGREWLPGAAYEWEAART